MTCWSVIVVDEIASRRRRVGSAVGSCITHTHTHIYSTKIIIGISLVGSMTTRPTAAAAASGSTSATVDDGDRLRADESTENRTYIQTPLLHTTTSPAGDGREKDSVCTCARAFVHVCVYLCLCVYNNNSMRMRARVLSALSCMRIVVVFR